MAGPNAAATPAQKAGHSKSTLKIAPPGAGETFEAGKALYEAAELCHSNEENGLPCSQSNEEAVNQIYTMLKEFTAKYEHDQETTRASMDEIITANQTGTCEKVDALGNKVEGGQPATFGSLAHTRDAIITNDKGNKEWGDCGKSGQTKISWPTVDGREVDMLSPRPGAVSADPTWMAYTYYDYQCASNMGATSCGWSRGDSHGVETVVDMSAPAGNLEMLPVENGGALQ